MEEIRIERLTKDRLKDVQKLILVAFGRRVSLDSLISKYETTEMCGVSFVCNVAYVGDLAVGFSGVLPMLAEQNGKRFLIGQNCDYYTHPNFQKKGILGQLLVKNKALLEELSISVHVVFHSEITHLVSEGKGWQDNSRMMRFHIDLKGLPWMKLLHKFSLLRGMKRVMVDRALKSVHVIDAMNNPASSENALIVPFTKEFIAYKNRLGNRIVFIEGCQLWLRFTNILQVGAINGLNEENVESVLVGLNKLAKKMGITETVIHEFEGTPTFHLLAKKLDPKPSFPVQVLSFNDQRMNYRPSLIELDAFL